MLLGCHIMVVVVVVSAVPKAVQEVSGSMEQVGVDVGVMMSQVLEHHLTGCHLVLVTTTLHLYVSTSVIRHMGVRVEAGVAVEAGWMLSQDQLTQDHLLQGLWGDIRTTCRALILDLTANNSADSVMKLVEVAGLWQRSGTVVVVVGKRAGVKAVLLHHSLRNTLHALYLAPHDLTFHSPPRSSNSRLRKVLEKEASVSERVWVYRRCLFCNNGEADVQLIQDWNLTSPPQHTDELFFNERFHDFMGLKMKFSAIRYFPYNDYTPDSSEPGSTVTLKDCLDARLLSVLEPALNCSSEIRAQSERAWGTLEDGQFTGMMGEFQREEIDIGMPTAPAVERSVVLDNFGAYQADVVCPVSLKPTLLPQYLSLIRPFAGELWGGLLLSVLAWGVVMWLLQNAWWWVTGDRGVKFSTALLYGWAVLLERPTSNPPVNDSGRLLVGWWLVFCLVVTTGYRSSLIAHLTVQGKSQPPETYEDLVSLDNWKWGTQSWMLKGSPGQYFSRHTDPVVQEINRRMEPLTATEGLHKVLEGRNSFITPRFYITVVIDSHYTDSYSQSPFYISKTGIKIIAAFGWSFRKGAPYYRRFHQMVLRLTDAGIIQHWTDDVIARRVKENRAAAALDPIATLSNEKEMVLGMQHMQGAFYLLFLGCGLVILILLMEYIVQYHPRLNKTFAITTRPEE
ncbi:probable glutamate receptor isoform X2 [Homarus americanus]|uniref:probable glutamate receptor isoform X2 n=1 Tax=Homarus americanus TaxID=6706 RepID=UPI001C440733|nr:probable glutamate receptor isoform X2 [Homarus americanus]